jgi:glutamyl/glutaminyl-tRNA synthetase
MNNEPSSAEGLYRGRLAPSPTGYLHVGHARTFWTAYERARDANGTLVMRVEDLDTQRSRPAFAEAAIEDLRWLGIRWQEGPDEGGPYGPYMQSQRQPFYLDAWHRLLRLGLIYPCRCSRKDLEAALAAPHERNSTEGGAAISDEDEEPIYPGTCRPGARREYSSNIALAEESAALQFDLPEGLSWRFALQEGEKVDFEDRNLGPQRYVAGRDFGDFVVWRRDGVPSYQLACVVDDAAMRITEVVRGADLLKSTARQILLNRALGYENPRWYHCPLAVDRYGIRLAKRHDSLSLRALRQRGLTPTEALSVEMLAEP